MEILIAILGIIAFNTALGMGLFDETFVDALVMGLKITGTLLILPLTAFLITLV